MAMGPTERESDPSAPQRTTGWFARVPLWVRILVPVLLVAGIAAAIIVPLLQSGAAAGPAGATESACRSEVLAEVEAHDMTVRELSLYDDGVTSSEEDVYLVRGEVAFEEQDGEGTERRIRFRCTVRFEDGAMQAPSIRYSAPISAD